MSITIHITNIFDFMCFSMNHSGFAVARFCSAFDGTMASVMNDNVSTSHASKALTFCLKVRQPIIDPPSETHIAQKLNLYYGMQILAQNRDQDLLLDALKLGGNKGYIPADIV